MARPDLGAQHLGAERRERRGVRVRRERRFDPLGFRQRSEGPCGKFVCLFGKCMSSFWRGLPANERVPFGAGVYAEVLAYEKQFWNTTATCYQRNVSKMLLVDSCQSKKEQDCPDQKKKRERLGGR